MSFFVCLLYVFKAAAKMVSKVVEEVEEDGDWDLMKSKELVGCSGHEIAEEGERRRHDCARPSHAATRASNST